MYRVASANAQMASRKHAPRSHHAAPWTRTQRSEEAARQAAPKPAASSLSGEGLSRLRLWPPLRFVCQPTMRAPRLIVPTLFVLLMSCNEPRQVAAPAAPQRPPPRGTGARAGRGETPAAPSARGAGAPAGSSGRGSGRGKAGGRARPDARTPAGYAALNVWQRVTHEACLHLGAGGECSTFASDHHSEFVERQQGFATRLSKTPLFEEPRELCDTIAERFHLAEKNGRDGKDWCDDNFSELVAHVRCLPRRPLCQTAA
jgi:hypothetical protein